MRHQIQETPYGEQACRAQSRWRKSGRQQHSILEWTRTRDLNLQRTARFREKNMTMFGIVMRDHTTLQLLQREALPTFLFCVCDQRQNVFASVGLPEDISMARVEIWIFKAQRDQSSAFAALWLTSAR